MQKKFDINSVKVFDPIRLEARVWTRLEKALEAQGVPIDSRLIAQMIEFAKAVIQFQNWKKIRSKRDMEDNFNSRLTTIRRLAKQLKKDEPIIDDSLGSEFLKRQLFFALFEKATIIFERSRKRNVRDLSSLDIELLRLVKILKDLKVPKPIETLASALQRSGVVKDISKSGWKIRTLQNRLTLVAKKGPAVKNVIEQSPMQLATTFLQKKLRGQSKLIGELSHSLTKMKESELYVLVPASSKFAFPYLFNNVISV